MSRVAPCRDCTNKRYPGCHAVCKDYLDWRAEKQIEAEKHAKKKNADTIVDTYMANTAERYKKRERKAKNVHGHRR